MSVEATADKSSTSNDLFAAGGEVGELMRSVDWAATPLGPPETWPPSLRATVRILISSRYQMWMAWGPELTYFYNDAYTPTLGVKHPWALGRSTPEIWREIWPDIGPLVQQVLDTGVAIYYEGMLLLLERSGFREETYHTFSYSPLFDDDGAVAGMFCTVVEETERVINERRLATLRQLASSAAATNTEPELFTAVQEQLSSNLADLPFTLAYLFDDDGSARLVARSGIEPDHPAATPRLSPEDISWPVDQLLGNSPALVVGELEQRFGPMPSGAWETPPREALVVPIAQQGHERSAAGFFVAGLNPFRPLDHAYRGFIELLAGQIGAALSNARAYEEERKRAEALAEIDRAKTTFFSNVSHEFRTPLTLMLGPLEDLMAQGGGGDGESRAQLQLAHRNGMRLLRLVNTLLDFSRIEAGRMKASYEPVDLGRLCAEIASSFRSAMEKAGLALVVETEPLSQPVYVDREMWEKVLLNLLSNAFKFTFEGEVRVTVGPSADGGSALVRVSDTGIGVPPEELPRLFERFHRVEGARGRSFEGSGIGLALVQELVKLHGGEIFAESEPGRGTTFSIVLPFGVAHLPEEHVRPGTEGAVQAEGYVGEASRWLPSLADTLSPPGADALTPERAGPAGVGLLSQKRVLLADDNADMRDYVRRLLEAHGCTVDAGEDGDVALKMAREAAPDLVLSDVMMPRLDGFGLLRAIREDPKLAGTPVILLSARAGEEAKVEGLDAGADDYLVKPFAARELIARVSANIQMAVVRRDAARAVMQSEQRFLMTQERLSRALSTGRVAVYDWRVDEDRLSIQGPLAEVFGVESSDAIQGLPLEAFLQGIHVDDRQRAAELVQRTLETGEPFEAEYRVQGGGEVRVILSRGLVETTEDGSRVFSGVLIDLTQEKLAEQALQALNATLEHRVAEEVAERTKAEEALRQAQKMEAVGQLTGGVAHDFNNLLTVIIGGLDTIRRADLTDAARIRRATDMALQGAQRAASLTGRLLAFSRRQPLDPRPIDLNLLVRDMTELLHRTLGETIELEGVLSPRLWSVEVDQNQLESAIINLAVNARDAMPEGGKLTIETANASLDESYSAIDAEVVPGQYVMVAVSDTGCGMSKGTLIRVFEPFFTTKDVGRGTGLGLSMVYGFVKQSGGHVTIYSEEGQGTTVKLYFPRHRGGAQVSAVEDVAKAPRASRGEVVLVVEDNEDVRNYSTMILTELGYEVLEAGDADQGLSIIASDARIDLLFTDVVLPGKTGRVLADEARIKRPGLKVLYTTGYSKNAIVHHGRLDPGVQLITKPFTFDELANRVRDVIDAHTAA